MRISCWERSVLVQIACTWSRVPKHGRFSPPSGARTCKKVLYAMYSRHIEKTHAYYEPLLIPYLWRVESKTMQRHVSSISKTSLMGQRICGSQFNDYTCINERIVLGRHPKASSCKNYLWGIGMFAVRNQIPGVGQSLRYVRYMWQSRMISFLDHILPTVRPMA